MPPTLDRLPLRDRETGDLTVVIETPKGSRHKYKYDPASGALRLGAVLGEGLAFPCDFGFFPSTLGADGDPLDVLLLLDHGMPAGSIAGARLIGVIEIEQRSQRKPWQRNDRFLAVPTAAHGSEPLKSLADLRPRMLDELEAFFEHYVGLEGKTLRILGRAGPKRALQLLEAGARADRSAHGARPSNSPRHPRRGA